MYRLEAVWDLLTSRPRPEYNKSHTASRRYNNWFIVFMVEEISRFVGGDVDSIIDDFVSWDNEVSSEKLLKLHDLADLFGDDAEAILEELKS